MDTPPSSGFSGSLWGITFLLFLATVITPGVLKINFIELTPDMPRRQNP